MTNEMTAFSFPTRHSSLRWSDAPWMSICSIKTWCTNLKSGAAPEMPLGEFPLTESIGGYHPGGIARRDCGPVSRRAWLPNLEVRNNAQDSAEYLSAVATPSLQRIPLVHTCTLITQRLASGSVADQLAVIADGQESVILRELLAPRGTWKRGVWTRGETSEAIHDVGADLYKSVARTHANAGFPRRRTRSPGFSRARWADPSSPGFWDYQLQLAHIQAAGQLVVYRKPFQPPTSR